MTKGKQIFCGDIRIGKKVFNIYLEDKEKDNDCIVLNENDLDGDWINNIITSSKDGICDSENSLLIRLYVLYSLEQVVYFSDLAYVLGIDSIISESLGNRTAEYYYLKLKKYLDSYGYSFKVLKSNKWLYKEGAFPYFSLEQYSDVEKKSSVFKYLKIQAKKKELYGKIRRMLLRLGRILYMPSILRKLKKNHKDVKPLTFRSQSGSVFFNVIDCESNELFVKAATCFGDSLSGELYASNKMQNSKEKELMVLAETSLSTERMLYYPYHAFSTLKDYCTNKKMNSEEYIRLCSFFCSVLSALRKEEIIHRDITPSNILVKEGISGIDGFYLSDFGTSICKGNKVSFRKHLSMTCGSIYRYSLCEWDDASSAFQIALELYPNSGDERDMYCLMDLYSQCHEYTYSWSPPRNFV